jgi:hypothetical protein
VEWAVPSREKRNAVAVDVSLSLLVFRDKEPKR